MALHIELFRHIGNNVTDLAQSLEEYKTELECDRFNGTTKIGIDGEVYPINYYIELIGGFAEQARSIEKHFKNV